MPINQDKQFTVRRAYVQFVLPKEIPADDLEEVETILQDFIAVYLGKAHINEMLEEFCAELELPPGGAYDWLDHDKLDIVVDDGER